MIFIEKVAFFNAAFGADNVTIQGKKILVPEAVVLNYINSPRGYMALSDADKLEVKSELMRSISSKNMGKLHNIEDNAAAMVGRDERRVKEITHARVLEVSRVGKDRVAAKVIANSVSDSPKRKKSSACTIS